MLFDSPETLARAVRLERGRAPAAAAPPLHEDVRTRLIDALVTIARGIDGRADAPPESPPDIPPITEQDDGWVFGGEVYAERRDALAAVVTHADFVAGVARKRPEAIDGLADFRWVDAAAVESKASASDGSQVTDEAIDAMVRNVAGEATPPLVDGAGVSEVHESAWNSAAKAAGWVFGAVKVVPKDGRAHLWLYVRLLPDVDAQLEAKQLLYGSICFWPEDTHRYSGEPIGARLISYALTNTPFIDGLEPHAARSQQHTGPRRVVVSRSQTLMTQPTPRGDAATPPSNAASADAAPRAVEGLEGPALEAAFADILGQLRRITGMADGTPASFIEMLSQIADGALKAKGEEQEEEPNAGPGGQPEGDEEKRERARAVLLEAELMGLRSRVAELEGEIESRSQDDVRAGYERHLGARLTACGRKLPDAERAKILDTAMRFPGDGREVINLAVRAANVPPQGVTMSGAKPQSRAAEPGDTALSQAEAMELCLAEVREKNPGMRTKDQRAKAYSLFKERYPALLMPGA